MVSRLHTCILIILALSFGKAYSAYIDYTPELYFTESCPGTYQTMTITIKNTFPDVIKLFKNPTFAGANPEFFSFVSNPLLSNDIDLPQYVNGENAIALEIKFRFPENDTTLKSAEIVIRTDFKSEEELRIKLYGSSTNTLYTYNPFNIDLGSIQAGKTYRDTVNFTNMGYEPVRLDSVLLGNQKLNFYPRFLNAEDTAQIPLEFNFSSTGEVFSSVRIFMNSICRDTMVIPFHANVDGSIFSINDNLNFGDTIICGTKELPVFIKPGAGPLTIKSVSAITGTNASVFRLVNPPTNSFSVPKEGYSLNVLYQPAVNAKFGPQSASFAVTVDDGSGTLQDVIVNLQAFIWKDSVITNTIDFGDLWVGTPLSLPFTIANRHQYPIVIDSIVLFNGDKGFSLDCESLKSYFLDSKSVVNCDADFISLQKGTFVDTARIYFSFLDCSFIRSVELRAKTHTSATLSVFTETESSFVDPKEDDFSVSLLATSPEDSVIASYYTLDSIVVSLPSQMLYFKSMALGMADQVHRDQDRWRITIIPEKPAESDTSIIAKLNCVPILGAVTSDSIFIEKVSFTDKLSSITINSSGSKLDLIYCDRGGNRLLNNERIIANATGYTRSLDGEIGVKFKATEIGDHSLRAFDLTGRLITSRHFNCAERGKSFDFVLEELTTGFYIIEINAPSQTFTVKALKTGF